MFYTKIDMDDFDDVTKSLLTDYETILSVNINTGKLSLLFCEEKYKESYKEFIKYSYDDYIKMFCQKFLFPEDRQWIYEHTKLDTIKETLKHDNTTLLNYRFRRQGQEPLLYRSKFARVGNPDSFDTVIIAGHSIQDKENLGYIEEIATAHHNAVIASLASDFDYICYIDTNTNHVHRFYASEVFKKVISTIDTSLRTYEKLQAFFNLIVYKEDKENFFKQIETKRIQEELEFLDNYEVYFRVFIENQIFYYKLKITRAKNDSHGITMGLMPFDEQMRTRIQHEEQRKASKKMEEQLEKLLNERTAEIQEKNEKLNRINNDIIEMIGDITEARDFESGTHIRRVKNFTKILANQIMTDWPEFNLTPEKVNLISNASALHDIGKISIPDMILLKPARLTPEEFEIMKTHTTKGCELLKKAPKDWSSSYLQTSMDICLYHHEKYDGKGYPQGLVGEQIPIAAQIVSIVDCYDALCSKRVYKDDFKSDEAYKMIQEGQCGTFSPKLLKSFINCKTLLEKQNELN